MNTSLTDQKLCKLLLATLVLVTLFVSPWNSVDPINLPKMTVLGILSFTVLGLLVSKRKLLLGRIDLRLRILTILFLTQFLVAALFVSHDLAFEVYGTPHRNTGILTYLCLVIIMIAAASIAKTVFTPRYLYTLFGTATTLGVYGLAQSQGVELFNYTSASGVFSTLGNMNFHSAFMGIAGSAALTYGLMEKSRSKTRIFSLGLFILCVTNIELSSSQGFLCLVAGLSVAVLTRLFSQKKHLLGLAVSLIVMLGSFTLTFAVFNHGPLAGFIYENSLKARGFYWDAGFRMMMAYPLFGVGIDGFGDSYLRFRSEDAATFNPQLSSDSAHNLFLDLGTTGGIPLLIAYLGIQIVVVISVIKRIRSSIQIDAVYLSLLAGWTAYQIQSLISINQIGLGVWGWTLSGLLIGLGHFEKTAIPSRLIVQRRNSPKLDPKSTSYVTIFSSLGIAFGLLVSVPPYLAANKFYRAMQSGQIQQLIGSADLSPSERTRYFYVAQILMENNSEKEAVSILQEASVKYPDYFPIWSLLAKNSKASPAQITKAKAEMKRLDPLNPEWK